MISINLPIIVQIIINMYIKLEFIIENGENLKIIVVFFQDNLIEAIGAGIYEIGIERSGKYEVLYIGESVFVLVRCASHLYALKKNPNYFGFTRETIDDSSVKLHFRLIEVNNDKVLRKQKEKKLIHDSPVKS